MYRCRDLGLRPIVSSENLDLAFAKMGMYCRKRVRERSLRYGLWQHCHLAKQFDAEEIFSCEGKTIMAIKYRQWRIKAVVLTRWQMQAVPKRVITAHPLINPSSTTDILIV